MTTYEHRVAVALLDWEDPEGGGVAPLEETLDGLSQRGWELVAVVSHSSSDRVAAILRRPKGDDVSSSGEQRQGRLHSDSEDDPRGP